MSISQNLTHKISESSFLHDLQKQEKAFRNFLVSLKKCPNKISSPGVQNSNIQTAQQIKTHPKAPHTNFRISFMLPVSKQKASKRTDKKQSIVRASSRKISQVKQLKQSSEVTNKNRLLTKRYKQKAPEGGKNLANGLAQYKTTQNFRSLGDSKLKIQPISSVTWNPDSHAFLTKLYQDQNLANSVQLSTFLLELLNMNASAMTNFLQQKTNPLTDLNQIQGKEIYHLFQQIFDIHNFSPIKDPLIKKYNNCIFFGEKPNFDSNHSGIILYFNRNAYFGSLKNFQKHGLGIDFVQQKNLSTKNYKQIYQESQKSSDYVIFRGNFYKNSKSGQFLIHAQDYVYQGFNVKGFFEGFGTLITVKSIFKGMWSLNNKVSGVQTFKTHPMAYEGEYLDNNFHGKGKLKNSDQFYEGDFKNGLKNGQGILVNKHMIYEGKFENDKKHGEGIIFDKGEYTELNPESEDKKQDFQVCIYKVQFENDEMVSKVEFKKSRMFEEQSLKTLEQEKSVYETVTFEFENIRPSKMLNSFTKDKVPEKKREIKKAEETKYNDILSVFPREPEEERVQSQRKNTYLLGNGSSRFPARTKRQME